MGEDAQPGLRNLTRNSVTTPADTVRVPSGGASASCELGSKVTRNPVVTECM